MAETDDLAKERLRALPSVDEVLRDARAAAILVRYPRELVLRAARAALAAARARILAGGDGSLDAALFPDLARALEAGERPCVRRAINATGVILHTGLGRAVLSAPARLALEAVARGYSILEVDPETGERGERETGVAAILRELTGAEAATVVNNNAAACLLALGALARGKEVVVARGQLVEIGGSFRIPEVMAESGARLREVGATNKVHLRDYEAAIGPETAAILKVHTSNFKIVGFTEEVPLEALAALACRHGVLLLEDLGSGCLVDLGVHGFAREPPVPESLRAGADLVTFSGDKLLGGPQCGIAVGRKDLVARLRRHPLFRAVRPDKLTLAALEATLRLYFDEEAWRRIPTLALLLGPLEPIRARAEALAARLQSLAPALEARAVPSDAQPGSGALPATVIPSYAVALRACAQSPDALARRLRTGEPAVFPRIQKDEVLFDLRTVLEGEDAEVEAAVRGAVG
jgi:L-seryl-tRNA(Ser) seleniumtransferase